MTVSKLVFTPLSYTGWGSLEYLTPEIEKHEAKRLLIVTDPLLQQIGLLDQVTSLLDSQQLPYTLYTDIVPEPPLETAEKLVHYTREGQFDLIIGVGGGSSLDLAKLAAVLAVHEGPVEEYLNLTGIRPITKKGLPKVLIPTTSGTGSEVTNIAVLSLDSSKDVVTHDYLLADAAIVDPALTVSLPPRVTAATGIDALTHAIEAYVSVNAGPTTDGLALQAIRLISRSLQKAATNGDDQAARTDMSHGSYIAGLAFFNAGVAGVHALAYPLGGQFHLPHGEANAVLLPYVMGYIRKSCTKRMADILNALGGNSSFLSEKEASYECVRRLELLVKDVGLPAVLGEYNIPVTALDQLTEDAHEQKRLLARSPLPLGEDEIRAIYQAAFDGVIAEPE
ncbi:iron-containing alcohol dehydrogenase [Pullulanibacillus sp. KACC 23026]|uniref:iron-containing alcohol dehydrogenase n=1 Tax=Pullulanibacillus sp. KACC 23026 TaxID=3028315 RepID=UPI0023AEECA5|nr:iron-containing alcohol dehydrogenase [Pullulanibacillus sp. KACC 23026]WEG13185.1 iron-containing alcohol dehydrogenase [Pullulanibacillus sp. KACC 23026]